MSGVKHRRTRVTTAERGNLRPLNGGVERVTLGMRDDGRDREFLRLAARIRSLGSASIGLLLAQIAARNATAMPTLMDGKSGSY